MIILNVEIEIRILFVKVSIQNISKELELLTLKLTVMSVTISISAFNDFLQFIERRITTVANHNEQARAAVRDIKRKAKEITVGFDEAETATNEIQVVAQQQDGQGEHGNQQSASVEQSGPRTSQAETREPTTQQPATGIQEPAVRVEKERTTVKRTRKRVSRKIAKVRTKDVLNYWAYISEIRKMIDFGHVFTI